MKDVNYMMTRMLNDSQQSGWSLRIVDVNLLHHSVISLPTSHRTVHKLITYPAALSLNFPLKMLSWEFPSWLSRLRTQGYQCFKDPGCSCSCGFHPWPSNFCMPQVQPERKKKKEKDNKQKGNLNFVT